MSVRKHFYLITEHKNDDKVGAVAVHDSKMTMPLKNEEGEIVVLDEETRDFETVGKRVGLGYHDFASSDAYENPEIASKIMREKVRGVNQKWAEKAGIADVVYGGDDE